MADIQTTTPNLVLTSEDGFLVTMDESHYKVHEGDAFFGSLVTTALNDGQTYLARLVTPANKMVHLVVSAYGAGAGFLFLFESPTISGNGTANTTTILNRNRNSTAVPGTALYLGATASANGTQLFKSAFGAGQHGAGDSRNEHEWILKPATDYLAIVESDSAANIMGLELSFYEE